MKNFFKNYLGLIAAAGLAGGSLFAFNISTSIDNALQVIKTIWVTSDGTTSNPPFMTIDGASGYVSIGTTASGETLNVSGSVFTRENEVMFFAGNDGGAAFGYPIPGVFMGVDGTNSSGAIAGVSIYDTRPVESNGKLGVNISSQANIGVNGAEAEASINTNRGDRMDIKVEEGFDLSNYDQQNHIGFVTSNNRAEVNMDPDHITIFTEFGVVRTATGGGDFDYTHAKGSRIDVDTNYIHMYGSGGYANMYFNTNLGLFGFAQNNPGNTIDIGGGYVPGTLGLRFSGRAGNAGQVLGLNNAGDVVLLGPLGGGSSGPWEYGAGSPQSAQIKGAGNTSNGSYSVVGGLNNIGDGYASFVGGGLYNEATSSGNVAVGGAYNKSYGLLLSSIVGGTNNTINSAGNVSFIGGGSDNIINERNSAIVVGSNNLIDAVSSAIVGGEYNAIHSSATQAFIGGGSGNATSGSLSFIGGGSDNMLAGLYATLVGGLTNILNGNYGFIGGGASNVLSVGALYSLIGGGENNSVTDRYSSIVGGLNNVNQAEKSFIGGGEGNNIDLNSLGAVIVGGYYNANSSAGGFIGAGGGNFATGGDAQFIGAGGNNIINEGYQSVIVGGRNNTLSGARSFIGGGEGHIIDSAQFAAILGGNMNTVLDDNGIVVGGESNQSRGYGDVIVGGIMNTINGARSAILGGNSNILSGAGESILVGGSENTLTNGNFSFLGAGRQNVIRTLPGDGYNTLIGGQANVISGGAYNSIVGGYDNTMWDGAYSFIGGGFGNTANVFYGTVAGGLNNIVAGFGGTIAGGLNNSSAGPASFIGGGSGNIAYSSYAATIGGNNIYANGIGAAIAGGHTNYANGANSFIAGSNNNTSGDNTVALGSYAEALHANTFVRSDGVPTFASLAPNTFLIKATNGVAINTNDTNNKALRVNGSVQANNYYSANDNAGHTQTIVNIAGGGCTMYFENGLLVATSGC